MSNPQRIINTYDQCAAYGGDRIVIYYHKTETGRGSRSAHFSVHRYEDGKKIVTDLNAAWYDYGSKTFSLSFRGGSFSERKKQALAEAIAWVKEKYCKDEFVLNRIGDYVEREVN